MNYNEQLIARVVEAYCDATGDTEFSKTDVAKWAIENGKWQPSLKSKIELLSDELSVAIRAERKVVDGRKIRQYHCITRMLSDGYVQTVWAHIDVATSEFMEQSVARRRKNLVSNAYQLHSDIVYWNENKNTGTPLQVLFDFRDDIADRDYGLVSGEDIDEVESADFQETD